jgi:hypothetical protein
MYRAREFCGASYTCAPKRARLGTSDSLTHYWPNLTHYLGALEIQVTQCPTGSDMA